MKRKEKFKEMQNKNLAELKNVLATKREELRDLRFKTSQNQLKTVRNIRVLRQEIAQLSTTISTLNKKS